MNRTLNIIRKIVLPLMIIALALWMYVSQNSQAPEASQNSDNGTAVQQTVSDTDGVVEGESYNDAQSVAEYIDKYGELPPNYITKNDAEALGWDSKDGNLDEVAPGKSIGGDHFGNYENQLPKGKWYECDIDYNGGYREAKRLIFSYDGQYYYTDDHYKTFTEIKV